MFDTLTLESGGLQYRTAKRLMTVFKKGECDEKDYL